MILNGVIAGWQFNPFYDILFLRTRGLIFYNVHVTSILTICFVCVYQIVKTFRVIRPFRWIAAIFASAGIHEYAIFLWNFVKYGTRGCDCYQDQVWYAVFIALGFIVATKPQRKMLLILTGYLIVIMGIYVGFLGNSDIQAGGAITQSFIVNSMYEVLGWVSTGLAWLFVKHQIS